MPDFRENGVIKCTRLESKKSASGAVKKMRGGMVAQNVEGGVDSTPPGRFRVNLTKKHERKITWPSRFWVSLIEMDPWDAVFPISLRARDQLCLLIILKWQELHNCLLHPSMFGWGKAYLHLMCLESTVLLLHVSQGMAQSIKLKKGKKRKLVISLWS